MSPQLAPSLQFFGLLAVLARPAIVATILFGLWRALAAARITPRARRIAWWSAAIFLIGWLVAVLTLAGRGVFGSLSSVAPAFASAIVLAALILPVATALAATRKSTSITAALAAAPLSWLAGVQVYRVLGSVFLRVWSQGLLPGYFALPAGIGDTLVGLTALPMAFALRSNSRAVRRLALAWNVFGILDLVNAISMGITSGLLHPSSSISPLLSYPLVIVPTFGVPLALILHRLSLLQLRRRAIAASTLGRNPSVVNAELA